MLDQRLFLKAAGMTAMYSLMFTLPYWKKGIPFVETSYWNWFIAISAVYQSIIIGVESYLLNHPNVMNSVSAVTRRQHPTIQQFAVACNTQVTCAIHTLIASVGAVWLVTQPSALLQDHLFGVNFWSQIHGIHTSAVFFTELVELLYSYGIPKDAYDNVMLLHHGIGALAFSFASYGVGTYYAALILLAELSSPILSLRWWMLQFNYGSTTMFKVVENAFAATFFLVRIVLGYFYITPTIVSDLLPIAMGGPVPLERFPFYHGQVDVGLIRILAGTVCFLLVVFHSFNAFFLYKIVGMATKSAKRNAKHESDETTELLKEKLMDEQPVTRRILASKEDQKSDDE